MKKVISILIAVALVLSMSVCAFAAEKPTDPNDVDAWTAYYTEVLQDADPTAIAGLVSDIRTDMENGVVTQETVTAALPAAAQAVGGETAQVVVDGILDLLGIETTTGDTGDIGDITLPSDGGSGSGGFIDSILGILGSIGDIIFGGDDEPENPEETTEPEDDWGDGSVEEFAQKLAEKFNSGELDADGVKAEILDAYANGTITDDNYADFVAAFKAALTDSAEAENIINSATEELKSNGANIGNTDNGADNVPNSGDRSVIAVATVALIAGAALVLTRKKSNDAE